MDGVKQDNHRSDPGAVDQNKTHTWVVCPKRDMSAILIQPSPDWITHKVVLVSIYMQEEEEIPSGLRAIVRHCENGKYELIVAADCNVHHPLWGMETSNNRATLSTDKEVRKPRRTNIRKYKQTLENLDYQLTEADLQNTSQIEE